MWVIGRVLRWVLQARLLEWPCCCGWQAANSLKHARFGVVVAAMATCSQNKLSQRLRKSTCLEFLCRARWTSWGLRNPWSNCALRQSSWSPWHVMWQVWSSDFCWWSEARALQYPLASCDLANYSWVLSYSYCWYSTSWIRWIFSSSDWHWYSARRSRSHSCYSRSSYCSCQISQWSWPPTISYVHRGDAVRVS